MSTDLAEDDTGTVVYLGNRDAVEIVGDGDQRQRRALPGKRCTTVRIPPGVPLLDAAHDIVHPSGGVWQAHSDGTPAWVASTDPALAQALAAHYGCQLRDPDPEG